MNPLPSCAKRRTLDDLEGTLKATKAIGKVCSIVPFYFLIFSLILFYGSGTSGVTSCQKWDVEKRVEVCEALVHQLQEDFYASVRDVAARDTCVFHCQLYNGISSISLLASPASRAEFNFFPPSPPPLSSTPPWTQLIIT